MSRYRCCPICGAALDPCEVCDCMREGCIGTEKNNDQICGESKVMGRP